MKYFGLILILISIISIVGPVQAYIITIDCPADIQRGIPFKVTGTTTFPQSASFDIVVYRSQQTANELARQTIITTPSQQFQAVFDTREMENGQYKVEVHNVQYNNQGYANSQLGSASVLYKIFKVIDRSDEVHISSPLSQPQDQALLVSGSIREYGSNVIEIRVFGPENYSFGPQSAITASGTSDKDGYFSFQIPVPNPGEYYASISDVDGFLTEIPFTVTAYAGNNIPEVQVTLVPAQITPESVVTKDTEISVPVSQPVPTPAPLSPIFTTIAICISIFILTGLGKRYR